MWRSCSLPRSDCCVRAPLPRICLFAPLADDTQSTIVCVSRDGRFGAGSSEGAGGHATVWDLTTLQTISLPAQGESAVDIARFFDLPVSEIEAVLEELSPPE